MKDPFTFSKNRRVAFICFSSSLGGLELSMLKLASELNKRLAQCIVIVPPHTPLQKDALQNNLTVEPLQPKWKYADITASIRLARIFKSHQTDVAVIMQSKDMSIVTGAHIISPHTKLVFYQEMQSGIDKRDFLHTWMHSHLTLWITLTQKMRQEVIDHTRMPKEQISVIPIGTDMHRFDPSNYDQFKSREFLGLPKTRFIVGLLGRLDPQKGQEELIRAVPIILKHSIDMYFVIAGDETPGQEGYKKRLMDLSHELGISNYIRFLPFTHQVPEFMSAIDLFVLPSHSETFGFVLIEAMAMGKVVVATNAGGVPEIITNGSTGLLVPPRNIPALAEALIQLVKYPAMHQSFSMNARVEALKRFDITHCIDQLVISLDAL